MSKLRDAWAALDGKGRTKAMLQLYDQIVLDNRLKATDLRVGWVLLQHVNKDTGRCWPSVRSLAERCRLTERSVQRSLRRLEDCGWYARVGAGGGDKITNTWMPNILAASPPTDGSPVTVESPLTEQSPPTLVSLPGDSRVTQTIRVNQGSESSLRSDSGADAPQARFQRCYTATQDAFSVLRRQIRKDVIDQITDDDLRTIANECSRHANGAAENMQAIARERLIELACNLEVPETRRWKT